MTDQADAKYVPRAGESWRDPFTMYAALRDHDPVHEVEAEDGNYWALSRFDDIMQAAIDFETFSSAQGLTFTYGDMEATGVEAPIAGDPRVAPGVHCPDGAVAGRRIGAPTGVQGRLVVDREPTPRERACGAQ